VPVVYIKGEKIGGCDDTMAAHKSGKLKKMLDAAGIANSFESSKIIEGSWKNKIVASCLQEERDKQDFKLGPFESITNGVLHKEHYQKAREAQEFVENHPILRNTHDWYEMTREE
jgi:hypothetical protein